MTDSPAGTSLARLLRQATGRAAWNTTDLWIAAFAIGGNLSVAELRGVLDGAPAPTAAEYDLLATALNEHFQLAGSPLMPYADQVASR